MSKNKTLCIAEWQAFGVEDIYLSLRGSGKSQALQSTSSCHTEALAEVSQQVEDRDSSVASLPQNDKNIDSRNDKELRDKAQKIFNELKAFAEQKGNFDDREGNHIFLTPYRNNRLKSRNYVGLIQTKSGFCLEILPKTFRTARDSEGFKIQNCTCTHPLAPSAREGEQEKCPVCKAKQILLDMLKTLKNSPFKQSHISSLKTQRLPLLEIFAMMFLDEVESLIKKGIKSDYVTREENRAFLKGKLLFSENLKHNFAHKERFFTASDEFLADIAPNRLIVSAIVFLAMQDFSPRTSGRISQVRFIFEGISPSANIDKDFAQCPNSRHYKSYELLLLWCKLFLKRQSFIPYRGSEKAFALLFDMNALFESFVAWHLKKYVAQKDYKCQIKAQESSEHLLEVGGVGKFQMKPDIVCRKDNTTIFIADTKWKILDFSRSDYGIAQGDLYQMFAYLAKYQCENGLLIFPKIDLLDSQDSSDKDTSKEFIYKAKSNLGESKKHKLQIYFFDCQNPKDSIKLIKQYVCV